MGKNKSTSSTKYAQFVAETMAKTRNGLNNIGKDIEREKLVRLCYLFALVAVIMALLYLVRAAIGFGWIR